MYIKNIIIVGFRSYKDQQFPDELNPKHNVIIGKNGSGKSNFFSAVQFVLSEKYANLRTNERRELFHTGAGANAMFVSVEIVFDNSDGRIVLPGKVNEDVIKIRRTVGLKQDEYRVNDRKYSAAEVRQLLESAGFSASNPYYIVEQGKIISLTQMRDEERYELLKEVAGTGVYESRRAESNAILEETAGRAGKIDEAVAQLDAKLKALQEESAELTLFQQADTRRKALEFALFTTEANHAKQSLEDLARRNAGKNSATEEQRAKIAAADAARAESEAKAAECARRVADLEQQRTALEKERAGADKRRMQLGYRADDATHEQKRAAQEKTLLEVELKELEKSARDNKAKLTAAKAKLDTAQNAVAAAQGSYHEAHARLDALQARRGRKAKFATQAERDKWLAGEVVKNDEQMKSNAREIKALDDEAKSLAKKLAALEEDASAKKNQTTAQDKESTVTHKERAELLKKRDELGAARRQLWVRVNEQEKKVKRAMEDLDRLRAHYNKAVRFDIRQGLKSLDEALQRIGDAALSRKVHGQMVSLFECEPDFQKAVEVTVGNAMFNVVVDDFGTSTRILDFMNKHKMGGRVTFFPLDTCRPREPVSAQGRAGVRPVIDTLSFNAAKFGRVFNEVFGRTLVADSLDGGARAQTELRTDVVTKDGDQFSRKGAVTGGFLDDRNLKLPVIRNLERAEAELATEKAALHALCEQVGELELDITKVVQALDQSYSQENDTRRTSDDARSDLRAAEDAIARVAVQKEQCVRSREAMARANANIQAVINALKAETKSAFGASLSDAEARELEDLQSKIAALRNANDTASAGLVQHQTQVQLLDDTARHVDARVHAVRDRIALLARQTGQGGEADAATNAVAGLAADVADLQKRIDGIDATIDETIVARKRHEDAAQEGSKRAIELQRGAEKGEVDAAQFNRARLLLLEKQEEAQRKIRALGAVGGLLGSGAANAADADSKAAAAGGANQYVGQGLPKIMGLLKTANDELKKYEHVNKKALEQFNTLSETRNDLHAKRTELQADLQSIHTLLDRLDTQKREVIERTFKQIQDNFAKVFGQLVCAEGAVGELLLVANPAAASERRAARGANANKKKSASKKKKDDNSADAALAGSEADGDDAAAVNDDPYLSVRIRCCFGLGEPHSDITQLSGGQKSLVALALIFAIQRADPAPFYLFDEIDAALDAEYRTNVARTIQRQSETAQFITVSFKTEMLDVADDVYRIEFHNKVSKILRISAEEGANVLRQAAAEDARQNGSRRQRRDD